MGFRERRGLHDSVPGGCVRKHKREADTEPIPNRVRHLRRPEAMSRTSAGPTKILPLLMVFVCSGRHWLAESQDRPRGRPDVQVLFLGVQLWRGNAGGALILAGEPADAIPQVLHGTGGHPWKKLLAPTSSNSVKNTYLRPSKFPSGHRPLC